MFTRNRQVRTHVQQGGTPDDPTWDSVIKRANTDKNMVMGYILDYIRKNKNIIAPSNGGQMARKIFDSLPANISKDSIPNPTTPLDKYIEEMITKDKMINPTHYTSEEQLGAKTQASSSATGQTAEPAADAAADQGAVGKTKAAAAPAQEPPAQKPQSQEPQSQEPPAQAPPAVSPKATGTPKQGDNEHAFTFAVGELDFATEPKNADGPNVFHTIHQVSYSEQGPSEYFANKSERPDNVMKTKSGKYFLCYIAKNGNQLYYNANFSEAQSQIYLTDTGNNKYLVKLDGQGFLTHDNTRLMWLTKNDGITPLEYYVDKNTHILYKPISEEQLPTGEQQDQPAQDQIAQELAGEPHAQLQPAQQDQPTQPPAQPTQSPAQTDLSAAAAQQPAPPEVFLNLDLFSRTTFKIPAKPNLLVLNVPTQQDLAKVYTFSEGRNKITKIIRNKINDLDNTEGSLTTFANSYFDAMMAIDPNSPPNIIVNFEDEDLDSVATMFLVCLVRQDAYYISINKDKTGARVVLVADMIKDFQAKVASYKPTGLIKKSVPDPIKDTFLTMNYIGRMMASLKEYKDLYNKINTDYPQAKKDLTIPEQEQFKQDIDKLRTIVSNLKELSKSYSFNNLPKEQDPLTKLVYKLEYKTEKLYLRFVVKTTRQVPLIKYLTTKEKDLTPDDMIKLLGIANKELFDKLPATDAMYVKLLYDLQSNNDDFNINNIKQEFQKLLDKQFFVNILKNYEQTCKLVKGIPNFEFIRNNMANIMMSHQASSDEYGNNLKRPLFFSDFNYNNVTNNFQYVIYPNDEDEKLLVEKLLVEKGITKADYDKLTFIELEKVRQNLEKMDYSAFMSAAQPSMFSGIAAAVKIKNNPDLARNLKAFDMFKSMWENKNEGQNGEEEKLNSSGIDPEHQPIKEIVFYVYPAGSTNLRRQIVSLDSNFTDDFAQQVHVSIEKHMNDLKQTQPNSGWLVTTKDNDKKLPYPALIVKQEQENIIEGLVQGIKDFIKKVVKDTNKLKDAQVVVQPQGRAAPVPTSNSQAPPAAPVTNTINKGSNELLDLNDQAIAEHISNQQLEVKSICITAKSQSSAIIQGLDITTSEKKTLLLKKCTEYIEKAHEIAKNFTQESKLVKDLNTLNANVTKSEEIDEIPDLGSIIKGLKCMITERKPTKEQESNLKKILLNIMICHNLYNHIRQQIIPKEAIKYIEKILNDEVQKKHADALNYTMENELPTLLKYTKYNGCHTRKKGEVDELLQRQMQNDYIKQVTLYLKKLKAKLEEDLKKQGRGGQVQEGGDDDDVILLILLGLITLSFIGLVLLLVGIASANPPLIITGFILFLFCSLVLRGLLRGGGGIEDDEQKAGWAVVAQLLPQIKQFFRAKFVLSQLDAGSGRMYEQAQYLRYIYNYVYKFPDLQGEEKNIDDKGLMFIDANKDNIKAYIDTYNPTSEVSAQNKYEFDYDKLRGIKDQSGTSSAFLVPNVLFNPLFGLEKVKEIASSTMQKFESEDKIYGAKIDLKDFNEKATEALGKGKQTGGTSDQSPISYPTVAQKNYDPAFKYDTDPILYTIEMMYMECMFKTGLGEDKQQEQKVKAFVKQLGVLTKDDKEKKARILKYILAQKDKSFSTIFSEIISSLTFLAFSTGSSMEQMTSERYQQLVEDKFFQKYLNKNLAVFAEIYSILTRKTPDTKEELLVILNFSIFMSKMISRDQKPSSPPNYTFNYVDIFKAVYNNCTLLLENFTSPVFAGRTADKFQKRNIYDRYNEFAVPRYFIVSVEKGDLYETCRRDLPKKYNPLNITSTFKDSFDYMLDRFKEQKIKLDSNSAEIDIKNIKIFEATKLKKVFQILSTYQLANNSNLQKYIYQNSKTILTYLDGFDKAYSQEDKFLSDAKEFYSDNAYAKEVAEKDFLFLKLLAEQGCNIGTLQLSKTRDLLESIPGVTKTMTVMDILKKGDALMTVMIPILKGETSISKLDTPVNIISNIVTILEKIYANPQLKKTTLLINTIEGDMIKYVEFKTGNNVTDPTEQLRAHITDKTIAAALDNVLKKPQLREYTEVMKKINEGNVDDLQFGGAKQDGVLKVKSSDNILKRSANAVIDRVKAVTQPKMPADLVPLLEGNQNLFENLYKFKEMSKKQPEDVGIEQVITGLETNPNVKVLISKTDGDYNDILDTDISATKMTNVTNEIINKGGANDYIPKPGSVIGIKNNENVKIPIRAEAIRQISISSDGQQQQQGQQQPQGQQQQPQPQGQQQQPQPQGQQQQQQQGQPQGQQQQPQGQQQGQQGQQQQQQGQQQQQQGQQQQQQGQPQGQQQGQQGQQQQQQGQPQGQQQGQQIFFPDNSNMSKGAIKNLKKIEKYIEYLQEHLDDLNNRKHKSWLESVNTKMDGVLKMFNTATSGDKLAKDILSNGESEGQEQAEKFFFKNYKDTITYVEDKLYSNFNYNRMFFTKEKRRVMQALLKFQKSVEDAPGDSGNSQLSDLKKLMGNIKNNEIQTMLKTYEESANDQNRKIIENMSTAVKQKLQPDENTTQMLEILKKMRDAKKEDPFKEQKQKLLNDFKDVIGKIQEANTNFGVNVTTAYSEKKNVFNQDFLSKFRSGGNTKEIAAAEEKLFDTQKKLNEKLKSFYNLSYSTMDMLIDSQFFVMYLIKGLRILFAYVSLFLATRVFTPMYEEQVYDKQKNPPSLAVYTLIFVGFEAAFNTFLIVLLFLLKFLFKTDDNDFIIDSYLFQKYVIDYFVSTLVLFAIANLVATVITNKKYFKWKYEGSRAIRAFEQMMFYMAIILYVIPWYFMF